MYYTLQQKIACGKGDLIIASEIRKNPFGLGDATFITEYCAVTGKYKGEKIYFENADEIKKDIAGLCV